MNTKLLIIDRYIIKKFLGTFFYALILILAITIAFDISEKVDDFIELQLPFKKILLEYYLNWIPYFANLFSSLFVFISVIFFTSKMATNTEIIAILSNGISFRRFLFPYFISALFIASLSLFLSLYIIPPANKTRLDFDNTYFRSFYTNRDNDIHKQIEPGIFVYIQSYSTISNVGYKFTVEKFENGQLKSKLISNYARWDSTKNCWTLSNYYIRNIDGLHESIEKGRRKDTVLNITPADFSSRLDVVETMTLPQLNTFIKKARLQGTQDIVSFLFDKHSRFAYPFSMFILTLIGVCVSSKKMKGGLGFNIGVGLLLSFSYIVFMRFSQIYALSGILNPGFAAWIPNILFGVIAVFLYRWAAR
ncbi:MAG: LptF/LptG family permease [Bacteroidales bacterium]|nr:LptF/LptG family permease [Bacteroidales bacterium]